MKVNLSFLSGYRTYIASAGAIFGGFASALDAQGSFDVVQFVTHTDWSLVAIGSVAAPLRAGFSKVEKLLKEAMPLLRLLIANSEKGS